MLAPAVLQIALQQQSHSQVVIAADTSRASRTRLGGMKQSPGHIGHGVQDTAHVVVGLGVRWLQGQCLPQCFDCGTKRALPGQRPARLLWAST